MRGGRCQPAALARQLVQQQRHLGRVPIRSQLSRNRLFRAEGNPLETRPGYHCPGRQTGQARQPVCLGYDQGQKERETLWLVERSDDGPGSPSGMARSGRKELGT